MGTAALMMTTEIVHLPVDKIGTNPYQPRKHFERAPLEELAESIRQYGVMQPINVRLINGTSYELVAGERRLRASKLAGKETIPAIIINITDTDSALLALIENLQRQNLNYLEEAEGYANLLSDYGFTQEQLAKRVGKSQSTIANKLRILRLAEPVQKMLLEHDLSERHARALLALKDEQQQLQALQKVIKDSLTVQKTEQLVESMLKTNQAVIRKKLRSRTKTYIRDIRLLTNTIQEAVGIMNASGVKTEYDVEESQDGCIICIMVSYEPSPALV